MDNKTAAPVAAEQPRTMVQATQAGFYRNTYLTRGMTFALITPSDFSSRWMRKVDATALDMIKPADPRRASRPGERSALSAFTPMPDAAPAKPGDAVRVADQSVI
jgi:hypothetical protein